MMEHFPISQKVGEGENESAKEREKRPEVEGEKREGKEMPENVFPLSAPIISLDFHFETILMNTAGY